MINKLAPDLIFKLEHISCLMYTKYIEERILNNVSQQRSIYCAGYESAADTER